MAVVLTGQNAIARGVRLVGEHHHLSLVSADGITEDVPWWRLYRRDDVGTTHIFRRLDRKDWELRVTAGSDRAILAHVGRRPFHRLVHPLRRLESVKVLIGVAVLAVTVADHAPAEWLARLVPRRLEHRLVDGIIAAKAPVRCAHEGGEAALRKILVRLDPDLGRRVGIAAMNEGAFVVTSTPGDWIMLFRSSMTEVDAAALPALLAHELSHIRHRDPVAATLRANGLLGTWGRIIDSSDSELNLDFSGLEERRADLEAMAMMKRAGIPLLPAARMFEEFRVSKAQGGYIGYDQRDFHFGLDARSQRWRAAAATDPEQPRPVLSPAETDALYNFCWSGPVQALPENKRAPYRYVPPGSGTLAPASKNQ